MRFNRGQHALVAGYLIVAHADVVDGIGTIELIALKTIGTRKITPFKFIDKNLMT
jgi:hypothetical protein